MRPPLQGRGQFDEATLPTALSALAKLGIYHDALFARLVRALNGAAPALTAQGTCDAFHALGCAAPAMRAALAARRVARGARADVATANDLPFGALRPADDPAAAAAATVAVPHLIERLRAERERLSMDGVARGAWALNQLYIAESSVAGSALHAFQKAAERRLLAPPGEGPVPAPADFAAWAHEAAAMPRRASVYVALSGHFERLMPLAEAVVRMPPPGGDMAGHARSVAQLLLAFAKVFEAVETGEAKAFKPYPHSDLVAAALHEHAGGPEHPAWFGDDAHVRAASHALQAMAFSIHYDGPALAALKGTVLRGVATGGALRASDPSEWLFALARLGVPLEATEGEAIQDFVAHVAAHDFYGAEPPSVVLTSAALAPCASRC